MVDIDNYEFAKIHWRNLKRLTSRITGQLQQNIIQLGKGILVRSNESHAFFQGRYYQSRENTLTELKIL